MKAYCDCIVGRGGEVEGKGDEGVVGIYGEGKVAHRLILCRGYYNACEW